MRLVQGALAGSTSDERAVILSASATAWQSLSVHCPAAAEGCDAAGANTGTWAMCPPSTSSPSSSSGLPVVDSASAWGRLALAPLHCDSGSSSTATTSPSMALGQHIWGYSQRCLLAAAQQLAAAHGPRVLAQAEALWWWSHLTTALAVRASVTLEHGTSGQPQVPSHWAWQQPQASWRMGHSCAGVQCSRQPGAARLWQKLRGHAQLWEQGVGQHWAQVDCSRSACRLALRW